MTTHQPALQLYEKLFAEAKADPGPRQPVGYVEDSVFERELTKVGIEHPSSWIEYMAWKESIGLPLFAKRLILLEEKRQGIIHLKSAI